MSGQELCENLGIDYTEICAYEAGTKRISVNLLSRIAKLIDVGPDYFFRGYLGQEPSSPPGVVCRLIGHPLANLTIASP